MFMLFKMMVMVSAIKPRERGRSPWLYVALDHPARRSLNNKLINRETQDDSKGEETDSSNNSIDLEEVETYLDERIRKLGQHIPLFPNHSQPTEGPRLSPYSPENNSTDREVISPDVPEV